MFKINKLPITTLSLMVCLCVSSFGYTSNDLEITENDGTYTCTLPLKWVQEARYKAAPLGFPAELAEVGEGEYSIPFSYTPADNERFSFVIPTGFPMGANLAIYDLLQGRNIEKHSKNPLFGVIQGDTINLATKERLGSYKKSLVDTPLQISQKLRYVYHLLKRTAEKDTQISETNKLAVVNQISELNINEIQTDFVKKSFEKLSQTISRTNSMSLDSIRKLFSELKDFSLTESDQRGAVLTITGPSGEKYVIIKHPRKNASRKVRERHYTEQATTILKKENIQLK